MLEYVAQDRKTVDPLMGWTGTTDMERQVRLTFPTRDDAIDYAERKGIAYTVEEEKPRSANVRPQGYGGNFAHNRRGAWTH